MQRKREIGYVKNGQSRKSASACRTDGERFGESAVDCAGRYSSLVRRWGISVKNGVIAHWYRNGPLHISHSDSSKALNSIAQSQGRVKYVWEAPSSCWHDAAAEDGTAKLVLPSGVVLKRSNLQASKHAFPPCTFREGSRSGICTAHAAVSSTPEAFCPDRLSAHDCRPASACQTGPASHRRVVTETRRRSDKESEAE